MPVRRSDPLAYSLASNLSATGAAVSIPGGEYIFSAEGTVGGSTISLQVQSPNGTWSDASSWGAAVKTLTLPFAQTHIDLPACKVRMAVTGGAPSALFASLVGIG